jgi:hypothetical protein
MDLVQGLEAVKLAAAAAAAADDDGSTVRELIQGKRPKGGMSRL